MAEQGQDQQDSQLSMNSHTSTSNGGLFNAIKKMANVTSVPAMGSRTQVLDLPSDFVKRHYYSEASGSDDGDLSDGSDGEEDDTFKLSMAPTDSAGLDPLTLATLQSEANASSLFAGFLKPAVDTLPPLRTDIATLVSNVWLALHAKELPELHARYARPENVPIFKVDLNEEVNQLLQQDHKPLRFRDMRFRAIQGAVSGAALTTSTVIDLLTKLEAAKTEDVPGLLTDVAAASVANLKFLSHANMLLNNARRVCLKPAIGFKYHALCKDSSTYASPLLFGDNLPERLQTLSRALRIGRPARQQGYFSGARRRHGTGKPGFSQAQSGKCSYTTTQLNQFSLSVTVPCSDNSKNFGREAETLRQSESQPESEQAVQEKAAPTTAAAAVTVDVPALESSPNTVSINHSSFGAGQVTKCLDRWAAITSDHVLLGYIRGAVIEFDHDPVQAVVPWPLQFSQKEHRFLREEIARLLHLNVIEKAQTQEGQFVSRIFLRPKKQTGKYRVILDLKALNEHVTYHHFKMDTMDAVLKLVRPHCYMLSLDLQDAYYSIAVAPWCRKYLRFQYDGTLYQFTCLPNGLASAPRMFTKVLKAPLGFLRRTQTWTMSAYIDDLFLAEKTAGACYQAGQETANLFQSLGFTISAKSQLTPVQCIEHIGFLIDSVAMRVSLPASKANDIHQHVARVLIQPSHTIRDIAVLLGRLEATRHGNRFAKLFCKRLISDKNEALRQAAGHYDARMFISSQARQDLCWWRDNIQQVFAPVYVGQPDFVIYTDASGLGWGCHVPTQTQSFGGRWTESESQLHINVQELLAILYSLQATCKLRHGQHVRVMTDNTTAMLDINNQGSVHSIQCNDMTRQIWEFAMTCEFWLSAAHVPGVDNTEADRASRKFADETEWSLNSGIFQNICNQFGVPDIDLFASRLNSKVPVFCAWKPDPDAMAVDAFTVDWQAYFGYIFPPFVLISAVLQKLQLGGGRAIVVVPDWPAKPWFALFRQMVVSDVMRIPVTTDTLFLPSRPHKTHALADRLTLLVAICSAEV